MRYFKCDSDKMIERWFGYIVNFWILKKMTILNSVQKKTVSKFEMLTMLEKCLRNVNKTKTTGDGWYTTGTDMPFIY